MLRKTVIFILAISLSFFGYALQEGQKAPNFKLVDLNGKETTLESLKGKVVLVDFWASWCVPCRRANPVLAEIYLKFHHKGFEILSVSLDEDKQKWTNAITNDKLPWRYHVNDPKGWNSDIVKQYDVEALPTSYLIDREGKIITVNPLVDDLEIDLTDYFRREISIYPKNASTKIYFSISAKYEIRDANNKRLLKGEADEVDISSLSQGLYTVKFENKSEQFLKKGEPKPKINIISKDNFKILLSSDAEYEIHDYKGNLISEGKSKEININSLEDGEYYIHINGAVEKIVKN